MSLNAADIWKQGYEAGKQRAYGAMRAANAPFYAPEFPPDTPNPYDHRIYRNLFGLEGYPGLRAIITERERQVTREGYTPLHDREHSPLELVRAAHAYLHAASERTAYARVEWPWDAHTFKPSTRERNLEKAGALVAAALDRLGEEITDA